MTPEQVFSIANLIAIVAWIMLVILPGQRWVTDIVTSVVTPLAFAVAYVIIVMTTIDSDSGGGGGFLTLAGVAALFSDPWMLLAGWIHYLAFDLLIGTWETRDARQRGLRHLLLIPCLVLTFLLGPAGWLLYMGVRLTKRSPRLMAA